MQPTPSIERLETESGEMITVWRNAEAENCQQATRSASASNDSIRDEAFSINQGIAFGEVPARIQPPSALAKDALKRRVYVIVSH